jgi:hypothetical protein
MRIPTFQTLNNENRDEIVELRKQQKENQAMTWVDKCKEETALMEVMYSRDLEILDEAKIEFLENVLSEISAEYRKHSTYYRWFRLTTRRLLNDVGVPGVCDDDFDFGTGSNSCLDTYLGVLPLAHFNKSDGDVIMKSIKKYNMLGDINTPEYYDTRVASFKKTMKQISFDNRKHALFYYTACHFENGGY